jgi:hypothetical protein
MGLDRLCAAKRFQSLAQRFNIIFYFFASVQTICTILCTIIYTNNTNPVFGNATRSIGLVVSFTASIISSFLLLFPIKNIYSDCEKASKLLLMSNGKKLNPDIKSLIESISIPCTKNPIFDCYMAESIKPDKIILRTNV